MDFFGDDESETPGQNTDSVEAEGLVDTTIEDAWALFPNRAGGLTTAL